MALVLQWLVEMAVHLCGAMAISRQSWRTQEVIKNYLSAAGLSELELHKRAGLESNGNFDEKHTDAAGAAADADAAALCAADELQMPPFLEVADHNRLNFFVDAASDSHTCWPAPILSPKTGQHGCPTASDCAPDVVRPIFDLRKPSLVTFCRGSFSGRW